MRLPRYEWHNGEPPKPGRTNTSTRTNWGYLLGVAESKPGKWLRTAAGPGVASSLNRERGFQATYRDGMVYVRKVK